MNGTVAPPSSSLTAAVTCSVRTPSSSAIRRLTGSGTTREVLPCAGVAAAGSGSPPGAGVRTGAWTGCSTGFVTFTIRFLADGYLRPCILPRRGRPRTPDRPPRRVGRRPLRPRLATFEIVNVHCGACGFYGFFMSWWQFMDHLALQWLVDAVLNC